VSVGFVDVPPCVDDEEDLVLEKAERSMRAVFLSLVRPDESSSSS
jgi:hypothetical protein